MQDERLRDDAKRLLRIAYERQVAGWIEQDSGADPIGRGEMGMPVRRITGRGAEVLREAIG